MSNQLSWISRFDYSIRPNCLFYRPFELVLCEWCTCHFSARFMRCPCCNGGAL